MKKFKTKKRFDRAGFTDADVIFSVEINREVVTIEYVGIG